MSIPTNAPRMYPIWCIANSCINYCTLSIILIIPIIRLRTPGFPRSCQLSIALAVVLSSHNQLESSQTPQLRELLSGGFPQVRLSKTKHCSENFLSDSFQQYHTVSYDVLCQGQFLKHDWTITNNLPDTPANSLSNYPYIKGRGLLRAAENLLK